MPLELSAEIDAILEKRTTNKDIEETREFLVERYNSLQDHIDKLREAIANGAMTILTEVPLSTEELELISEAITAEYAEGRDPDRFDSAQEGENIQCVN